MKCKVSKKEVRNNYNNVLCVGYCDMQYLLSQVNPFAYSARAEGWACDYYDIGNSVCISTGYAPIGERVPTDLCRKYDDKARAIISNTASYDRLKNRLNKLIEKFKTEFFELKMEEK